MTNCTHNTMIERDSDTHCWECADCGYVYGSEPFTLTPEPQRPVRFDNAEGRQKTMFDGMNCLPGQGDLFSVSPEDEQKALNAILPPEFRR